MLGMGFGGGGGPVGRRAGIEQGATTHNYSHARALQKPHQQVQPTQYLPPALPLLLPACHNHSVRNQRHSLEYDREAHDEPH